MPKEEAPPPALNAHQRQINIAITFCEDHKWFILAAVSYCASDYLKIRKNRLYPFPPTIE